MEIKTLILEAEKSNDTLPDRIIVNNTLNFKIGTVFCDSDIELTETPIRLSEIKQITAIAENFYLIFNNLIYK